MAAGQLSLTRRALLAGACAAPLVAPVSASAPEERWTPDQVRGDGARARAQAQARWERSLGRFRAADAAISAATHSEDEALYDRLGDRHDAAIKRLLRTAAPDLPALALKLDLLVAQQAWEVRGGESCLAAIRQDAHRLAAG